MKSGCGKGDATWIQCVCIQGSMRYNYEKLHGAQRAPKSVCMHPFAMQAVALPLDFRDDMM